MTERDSVVSSISGDRPESRRKLLLRLRLAAALALLFPISAASQGYQPPRHSRVPSPLLAGADPIEIQGRANDGMQIERDRSPGAELEEHRKLERSLGALVPQRRGVVDAYIVSIALDSDPVFAREARVGGDVLKRRYGAVGRTVVLAGADGSGPSVLPRGTPQTLGIALARVAELMNREEDVLVLFTTSHGARFGLYYHDSENGYGAISPSRLRLMLDELGIANRLLILSACYSGVFVPVLRSDRTAIVTAASADRTSFGCAAENDWTYFGDAMINRALRKPQPLDAAFAEASGLIASWESQTGIAPSQPQFSAGPGAARWLAGLDSRAPKAATAPVGRPAFEPSGPLAPRR